jgi:hypothetical protein
MVESPLHIVIIEGVTATGGVGFTVTVTWADAVQPLLPKPITVYVVVVAGLAVTLAPVDALRVDEGVHP